MVELVISLQFGYSQEVSGAGVVNPPLISHVSSETNKFYWRLSAAGMWVYARRTLDRHFVGLSAVWLTERHWCVAVWTNGRPASGARLISAGDGVNWLCGDLIGGLACLQRGAPCGQWSQQRQGERERGREKGVGSGTIPTIATSIGDHSMPP